MKKLLFLICLLFNAIAIASGKHLYVINVPDSHYDIGMFASCNLVLGHLQKFDKGQYRHVSGMMVKFDQKAPYYDPKYGTNWWTYYFEPLEIGTIHGIPKDFSRNDHLKAWDARRELNRERANELLTKYVKIKDVVIDHVEKFIQENFTSSFIIGVHYRGTDKRAEAPRVSYQEVLANIQQVIDSLDESVDYQIFIATDEKNFINQAKVSFPKKVIATNAYRSDGLTNIHHSKKHPPYELGMEAMVDMCLLSKCDILIRTSSSLSLWSTYMNPHVPVILLNEKYHNIPE